MVSRSLAETPPAQAAPLLAAFALVGAACCGPAASPAAPSNPPLVVEPAPPAGDDPAAELPTPRSTNEVPASTGAWIGVELRASPEGALLTWVLPDAPAATAGLRAGDVLARVAGEPITEVTDVHRVLETVRVGDAVPVVARRGGKERLFRLVVAEKPTRQELMTTIYVGKPAPAISSLTTLRGTVVPSLPQLRGNVVVLEFWASFCMACRAITPDLNRWNREREVLGLRVLGITMDPIEVAENAVSSFEIEYSVHLDVDGEVTRAFRGTALPTLFLIDKSGVVRDVVVGYEPARLERMHSLAGELLSQN